MRKYTFHIILIVSLSILWIVFEWLKPVPIDWTPTLINTDKIPYGTYILFHESKSLFPNQTISVSRQPVDNQLSDTTEKFYNYILISPGVTITNAELQKLRTFIARGNHVFIAADDLENSFCDSLGIKLSKPEKLLLGNDTLYKFCNPAVEKRHFAVPSLSKGYFTVTDSTLNITGLMEDGQKRKVMVKIQIGDGSLIICSLPLMFTNWFILQPGMSQIPFRALSYLPTDRTVVWDEYMKQGRDEDTSPLRIILKNKALSRAYFLTLFGIVLILVFETRRRRSMVPVVEPLKNNSLDFVKVVGLLHYEQRNYSDIAHKRITYFLERIRTQYHMTTVNTDKEFAIALAEKSGYGQSETENLVNIINQVRYTRIVSPDELIELNKALESFMNKTKLKI